MSSPAPPDDAPPDGALIDDEGIWVQVLKGYDGRDRRPALFLDRDGVVNEEVSYLHRREDVALIPGVAGVISAANRLALPVVLVTNQAGIAHGILGWREFGAVQGRILGELEAAGAFVDGVFACPHHPAGKPPYRHPDHPARKPNPGMLLRAAGMLAIDLAASWIVGDRASDLAAGRNAGLAGGIHVATGYGGEEEHRRGAMALAEDGFAVLTAPSIAEARGMRPLLADA